MGLSRSGGQRLNYGQRLAAIAEELGPERPPFWVSQPDRSTPAQGWWWTPKGAARPSLLGHNHIYAEMALVGLLDAQAPMEALR